MKKRRKKYRTTHIRALRRFDNRSIRTKRLSGGKLLRIGCPKGKWMPRKGRCRVGTRAVSVLTPRKHRKVSRSRRPRFGKVRRPALAYKLGLVSKARSFVRRMMQGIIAKGRRRNPPPTSAKNLRFFVFIHKSYFPPELRTTDPGKEDFEQWTISASSRTDAAKKVWEKHGKRLLELMGPKQTWLPRKVSLFVGTLNSPTAYAGRLPPVLVYTGHGRA